MDRMLSLVIEIFFKGNTLLMSHIMGLITHVEIKYITMAKWSEEEKWESPEEKFLHFTQNNEKSFEGRIGKFSDTLYTLQQPLKKHN